MSNENYVSAKRLEELKEELHTLKHEKRKEVAKRIEEAKALGDLKENAEYMEAREEQAFTEGRIQELEELIRSAKIIEEERGDKSSVSVGDTVVVKPSNGDQRAYTIVGSNETDPLGGKISNQSPLGKQLLGKTPGDTVAVATPSGSRSYTVVEIR